MIKILQFIGSTSLHRKGLNLEDRSWKFFHKITSDFYLPIFCQHIVTLLKIIQVSNTIYFQCIVIYLVSFLMNKSIILQRF